MFTLVDYEIGQITCFNSLFMPTISRHVIQESLFSFDWSVLIACFNSYSLWSKFNELWHNYEFSSSSRLHSSCFHRECY